MLRRLGLVDEHQLRGVVDGNLAHHLAADAAGRTGDHDAAPGELLADGVHVDDNLVARQEVLDADFLQLRCLDGGVVVVELALALRNVDVDAGLDDLVLQGLVAAEFAQPVGRDDECLDAVLLQPVYEMVVDHADLHAHQHVVVHLLLDGGEALQLEPHRLLVADVLGNGDAVVLDAEDVGSLRAFTGKDDVIEYLHRDADNP